MSNRYEQVKLYNDFKLNSNSPVDILKGAIYIDKVTNKAVFQLKFVNTQESHIKAVYINVKGYNDLGEEIEHKKYEYLDLNVGKGEEFGTKQLKELSNNTIRNIDVELNTVVFLDNQQWRSKKSDVKVDKEELEEIKDEYVLKVADNKVRERLNSTYNNFQDYHQNIQKFKKLYKPTENDKYWSCICGAYNSKSNDICYNCNLDRATVFNEFSSIELQNGVETLKQNTKTIKILIVIIVVISVIVFGTIGMINDRQKKSEYMQLSKELTDTIIFSASDIEKFGHLKVLVWYAALHHINNTETNLYTKSGSSYYDYDFALSNVNSKNEYTVNKINNSKNEIVKKIEWLNDNKKYQKEWYNALNSLYNCYLDFYDIVMNNYNITKYNFDDYMNEFNKRDRVCASKYEEVKNIVD